MRAAIWLTCISAIIANPIAGMGADSEITKSPEARSPVGSSSEDTLYKVIFQPKLEFPKQRPEDLGREAIVYVRFLISPKGLPVQVELDESRGYFNDAFKAAALNYVLGMRFQPATHNGEPFEAGPVLQPIKWGYVGQNPEDMRFLSDEFKDELIKVGNLMRKHDYSGADFHAEWMLRETVKLNYEYAVLQAQLAETHAAVGNLQEALKAATAATSRPVAEIPGFRLRQPIPPNDASKYLLPKDLIVYLLRLRMQLEAQSGSAVAALKTYNELAGLTNIKPKDQFAVLAEKLVALLESGRPLGVAGQVVKEYWSHELFHPSFAVTNVEGKIDHFQAHCRAASRKYAYVEEGGTMTLPTGAEACEVDVYGDAGTTFTFVEIPAAGAAAPVATP